MAMSVKDLDNIPEWWNTAFGHAWAPVSWTVAVSLAALAVGSAVGHLVTGAARRWADRTETLIDDAVVRHLRRPLRVLFPLLTLSSALPLTAMSARVRDLVQHVLLVLLILSFGWVFFRVVLVLVEVVENRYERRTVNDVRARSIRTQARGLRNIAGLAIALLTLGFALLSFDTVRQVGAGLLASGAVAGVILGVAAQRTLATVFAGLQIAISQPIRVDDVVIVEGEWGTIEEITLTYVVVRIWDLRRLIVPINYFIEKPFQNWTRSSTDLLGAVELYVDYTVDVEQLRAELQRIVSASPYWDKKFHNLLVTGSSDRAMIVRPLMSAKDASSAFNLRCEVREKLIAFLQRNYPNALPRIRSQTEGPGDAKAATLA